VASVEKLALLVSVVRIIARSPPLNIPKLRGGGTEMYQPEIRAEPELKCGVCEHIGEVGVLEGMGLAHWTEYHCLNCGADYEVKLEVVGPLED
jgi:hypothetical protein